MLILFGMADSGRVKVFVRIRPPRPQESSRKELIAVDVQEASSLCSRKELIAVDVQEASSQVG